LLLSVVIIIVNSSSITISQGQRFEIEIFGRHLTLWAYVRPAPKTVLILF